MDNRAWRKILGFSMMSEFSFWLKDLLLISDIYPDVLVSAGTELIFFTVSGMILSFGSGTKTILITHQHFSCCWAVLYRAKDILASVTVPSKLGWGVQSCWEGTEPGQLAQNWPKGYSILYDIIWKNYSTERGCCCCSETGIEWWEIDCALFSLYIYISQNHRISGVGTDLKRSSPTPLLKQVHHNRSHKQASRQVLDISIEGDSTTNPGNLFQCSVPFTTKKIFHMFIWNFLCSSFMLLLFVLSLHITKQKLASSICLSLPFRYLLIRSPLSLLFSRLNWPSLVRKMLQVLYRFYGPLKDSF